MLYSLNWNVTFGFLSSVRLFKRFWYQGGSLQINVNVKDEVKAIRAAGKRKPVQPYLLGLAPQKSLTRIYVVVDSKFIDLGKVSLLKGLDILFKVFHVFNAKYPLAWKPFWEFVEHGIYGIEKQRLTNSGVELLQKVKLIQSKI